MINTLYRDIIDIHTLQVVLVPYWISLCVVKNVRHVYNMQLCISSPDMTFVEN